jgi:hypothetical protein
MFWVILAVLVALLIWGGFGTWLIAFLLLGVIQFGFVLGWRYIRQSSWNPPVQFFALLVLGMVTVGALTATLCYAWQHSPIPFAHYLSGRSFL